MTVYAYVEGQSEYAAKRNFTFNATGTTLYKSLEISVLLGNQKGLFINNIIFEFTPIYSMTNTQVLAIVTGTPIEDSILAFEVLLICIIVVPILCCIGCIVAIICCCCCPKSPPPVPTTYQNSNNQPLFPDNQPI